MEQRHDQQKSGQKPQAAQASPRQQQQFDSGTRQPGGSEAGLADQIRAHMDVVDQRGVHIGTVDHVDGDRIKLTRASSPGSEHDFVPLNQVSGIDGNRVRLRDRGDTSFGMAADT